MTKSVPKGYVKVCEDRHGRFLCVTKKIAKSRNWNTKRAVIYNENSGRVSQKFPYQVAFKWATWYLLPEFEEEKE